MGASHASELPPGGNVPKPRFAWLALFQLAVIAAVVALARITRGFSGPPTLEDRLSAVGEKSLGSAVQSAAWGGRGWLVAVVAMAGALLLMLPIAWAYVATRERRKVDHSVVTTITLLPIAVAAILVIVQDSLAIAFSLAGIAGLVRFRNSLDDTKDAMYVFIAIAVGLGAGVGALEASAALSGLYNLVVVALWKWQTSQPAIADIALGEQPAKGGVMQTLLGKATDRHPAPNGRMVPAGGGEVAYRGPRGPRGTALQARRDAASARGSRRRDPAGRRGRAGGLHQAMGPRVGRPGRGRPAHPHLPGATQETLRSRRPARGPSRAARTPAGGILAQRVRGGGTGDRHVRLAALVIAGPALLVTGAAGRDPALPHYALDGKPTSEVHLDKSLREISGIAFTADGRLLAHGDEHGLVWQLDPGSGKVLKRFGLGRAGHVLKGDFEDIQVVNGRVFLVTSGGEIVAGSEGADGAVVSTANVAEELQGACEVEGLAWDEPTHAFLLLCKEVVSRRWRDAVIVLGVNSETWQLEPKPRMIIPEHDLERATGTKGFHGSAMVRHPRTGTYLLLAGPEKAYAEVDAAGRVLGGGKLDGKHHRQPEGIAIAPDLSLLISDEGGGKDATLATYAWHP